MLKRMKEQKRRKSQGRKVRMEKEKKVSTSFHLHNAAKLGQKVREEAEFEIKWNMTTVVKINYAI